MRVGTHSYTHTHTHTRTRTHTSAHTYSLTHTQTRETFQPPFSFSTCQFVDRVSRHFTVSRYFHINHDIFTLITMTSMPRHPGYDWRWKTLQKIIINVILDWCIERSNWAWLPVNYSNHHRSYVTRCYIYIHTYTRTHASKHARTHADRDSTLSYIIVLTCIVLLISIGNAHLRSATCRCSVSARLPSSIEHPES